MPVQITDVQTLTSPLDGKRTFVVTYAGDGIHGTMRLAESLFPEPLKRDKWGDWYAEGHRVDRVLSAYPHSIDNEDAARAAATVALKGMRLTKPDPPRTDARGKQLDGNAAALVRSLPGKPCPLSLSGWHALRYRKLNCHEYRCDGFNHLRPLARAQHERAYMRCAGFHYGQICGCGFREHEGGDDGQTEGQ